MPLVITVAKSRYPIRVELAASVFECQRVEYRHRGVTLEPDAVEEAEVIRDESGRITGTHKEVYPWAGSQLKRIAAQLNVLGFPDGS